MDRDRIERTDFSTARRGYDREEVDAHLRRIATELADLERPAEAPAGLGGTAAEQIKGIIDAAERSAAEIQQRADQEASRTGKEAEAQARRVREDAEAHARELRERAEADAAAHVDRVRQATDRMLERGGAAEAELGKLLEGVRTESEALVGNLRSTAESVHAELDQVRQGLPALRETRAGAGAAAAGDVEVTGEEEEELPAQETPDEFATEEAEPAAELAADSSDAASADEVPEPVDESEPVPVEEGPRAAERETAAGEPQPADERATDEEAKPQRAIAGSEGARLIALNMALNGTPRDETARYLSDNFHLEDQDAVLDEVYARVGG